jgi:hypothetical protein
MDWDREAERNWDVLERILALLLAFAALPTVRAVCPPPPATICSRSWAAAKPRRDAL